MDLFSFLGDDEPSAPSVSSGIVIPAVEEFPRRELMAREKDVTGLYLSGHPMDEYRDVIRRSGVTPIGLLMEDFAGDEGPQTYADGHMLTLAGVVDTVKTKTTKRNSLMSYVRLEDDSGGIELIVFQRALDQGGSYLIPNQGIIVKGRVSVRDEKEPQLMVDTIHPLTDLSTLSSPPPMSSPPAANPTPYSLTPTPSQTLWVKLPSEQDPLFGHIRLLLTMFPGPRRMIIYCEKEKKRIGTRCIVHDALLAELRELCGDKNVVLK